MADDLSFLSERVRRALSADEHVLAQLRQFDDEYADLQSVVRALPEKTSHEIMVPFTDVAFFPGRLIHTNELTVLLGSDLYTERSASQTLEIIGRRRDMLREKIRSADAGVDAMGARLGALDAVAAADGGGTSTSGEGLFATRKEGRAFVTSKPDGTVEITESYENDEPLDAFDEQTSTSGETTTTDQGEFGEGSKELDDFIARLEALEMKAELEGDEEEDGVREEKDSDDDSDYDERDALETDAKESSAGVNRLARWKAEQAAILAAKKKKNESGASAARRVAVGEVTERTGDTAGRFTERRKNVSSGETENTAPRPMSKFKMRSLGIDPDK
jgi:unconventional prefoldin RPB5 interactor 1